mgnify:CR=1 FL=1
MKGFATLPIIIVAVILLAGFFLLGSRFRDMKPPAPPPGGSTETQHQQVGQQRAPNLGAGINKPFYEKDGLYLTHTWPGEKNFSNEETEILVFNESGSSIEVKSFELDYTVEGKVYPHKSETWEKFPSKESWERIEYIIISAQHYQGQPLALARGEKGKLHWHINFGNKPLDGKQKITLKLTLVRDGQTIIIEESFTRDSGEVVSKEEH